MQRYYDKRFLDWRDVPDCGAHGLRWNSDTQRCDRVGLLDRLFDGGGGKGLGQVDFSFDPFSSFTDGGGGGLTDYTGIDYSSLYDTSGFLSTDTTQQQPDTSQISDPFAMYYDYYLSIGYSPDQATAQATQDTATGPAVQETTSAPLPLPTTGDYSNIPLTAQNAGFDILFPPIPEPPTPAPPPTPTTPTTPLPGYCPAGTYHPMNDPFSCVPFPTIPPIAPPKPPTVGGAAAAAAGKAAQAAAQALQPCPAPLVRNPWTGQCVQQQTGQCLPGQYRSAQSGQCLAIPPCAAGTVWDQNQQKCVARALAVGPQCPIGYWPNLNTMMCELIPQCPTQQGYTFDMTQGKCVRTGAAPQSTAATIFSQIPWWLWVLLAFALLSHDDDHEQRKTTTVQYRRAS